ncbi:MAG: hypothetical protein Q8P41_08390 [Pseudomonadota bacterium]|nr:hypothetical protein [Pseudomonadota bacterium]
MRFLLAVPFLVSSLACAGIFVEPEEGDYEVEVSGVDVSAACEDSWGLDVDAFGDIEVMEVEINAASDEVTLDGVIECELAGAAFDCEMEDEQDFGAEDYDATFVTSTVVEGKWTTSTTLESDWEVRYSCDGADCGGVESCEVTFTLEGELD